MTAPDKNTDPRTDANERELTGPEGRGEIVLYQTEDGTVKVECRFEDESIWMTQQLMADLFQTTKQNISLHIQNIYAEGELTSEATVKKSLTVRREGRREVRRELEFYNLDMIISVGYPCPSAFIRGSRAQRDKAAPRLVHSATAQVASATPALVHNSSAQVPISPIRVHSRSFAFIRGSDLRL